MGLTLDDYTAKALEQGIRGRENALTFENAGYTRRIAFRQTDSPNMSLSYLKTRGETTAVGATTPTDTYQSNLTLNELLPTGTAITATGKYDGSDKPGFNAALAQPIYLFVKNPVMRTRKRATLSYESAEDSFASGLLSIRNQARSLYYDVMLKEEGIKVEKRKVDSSRSLHEVTVALVEAGKLAPVESMRSKIRLQTDERQLRNADVDRQKAILNAKNFIYVPLEQPVNFLTHLEFKPFTIPVERLIEYALLHRPELKNLRRSQELSRIDFAASKEVTRPTLSLNSTYGYSTVQSTFTRSWTVTGAANWLFFDSFIARDQADQARIGEIVADLNLAETEKATRLDVQNAYLDVKNAEQQITDFQASREQAHRNVEVLRLRFQNGLDRLIDVFDAETQARSLDFEYLGLVINYNRSKDNLSQLIGGDVEKVP